MIDLKNNLKFLIFFKYALMFALFLLIVIPAMYSKNLFVILYNYHIYDAFMVLLLAFVIWCFYRVMIIFLKKEIKNDINR